MIKYFWLKWLNRYDAALTQTRVIYSFTGYDQEKAAAGYKRSQRQTPSGHVIPTPKKAKPARLRRVANF